METNNPTAATLIPRPFTVEHGPGRIQSCNLRPVLQDWVMRLSMMQQTVLMTAVRGPDGLTKYHPAKNILRWYRRSMLYSAVDNCVMDNPYSEGGGSFNGPSIEAKGGRDYDWQAEWEKTMEDDVLLPFFAQTDSIPLHFFSHLMHGAQIMGYHHLDERIAKWWLDFYVRCVHMFHLWPETREQMNLRLSDNRENWAARCDPATLK